MREKNEIIIKENKKLIEHFAMMEMKAEEYVVEHRSKKERMVKAKIELEKATMKREAKT